jgi:hypothetical protein
MAGDVVCGWRRRRRRRSSEAWVSDVLKEKTNQKGD